MNISFKNTTYSKVINYAIPECSLRQAIVKEAHEGLEGHFGQANFND